LAWSGLIRPPQLQHSDTDAGTQRTATWLELFFDLAFLLVVAELAVGLRNDLTPHGVLVFAGLFSSVWWAWAGFTFYANRFDTDDLVYRLAKLAAMLAVAGLAASVAEATSTRAAQFAICQAVLRLVLVALYRRAYRHVVQARGVIAVYLVAEGSRRCYGLPARSRQPHFATSAGRWRSPARRPPQSPGQESRSAAPEPQLT
jgi:low temperature requirement protein LtrA